MHVSPSPVFARKGNNLEVEVPLSIPEALRGAEVQVPTLNGAKTLRVAAGHQARHRPAAARRGAAEPGGAGDRRAKGDIHYRFLIDVPEELNEEQADAVEALAKTLDGDPRARLFEACGGARAQRRARDGAA